MRLHTTICVYTFPVILLIIVISLIQIDDCDYDGYAYDADYARGEYDDNDDGPYDDADDYDDMMIVMRMPMMFMLV